MTMKPVQVSLDTQLLGRIDADPEAKEKGRSAFIRSAVRLYLRAKGRREVDARIRAAYDGQAEAVLDEIVALMGSQEWPHE